MQQTFEHNHFSGNVLLLTSSTKPGESSRVIVYIKFIIDVRPISSFNIIFTLVKKMDGLVGSFSNSKMIFYLDHCIDKFIEFEKKKPNNWTIHYLASEKMILKLDIVYRSTKLPWISISCSKHFFSWNVHTENWIWWS